jgi:hypothetical protein
MEQTIKSPAIEVAKDAAAVVSGDKIVVLPTGIRAKLMPVSASLIDAVSSRIKDPEIPNWHNTDKDRDEPNPNDPTYQKQLEETQKQRGLAAMDALVMFGVELLEEIPNKERWLAQLGQLSKHGLLDLSEYNLEDPIEIEFLYKKFYAVDAKTLEMITDLSNIRPADVERAENSFPGDDQRKANSGGVGK